MTIYDHSIKTAEGTAVSLNEYRGKVMLIVNTATGCGFTPQYEGLQELYEKYGDKGLEILDIPCNQFGGQAPGSNDEIADFCQSRYGVTFRQFAKTIVNGKDEEPLYTYLKAQKKGVIGGSIKWNFTKFLVDRNGNVVERYSPTTPPEKIEKRIKELL